MNRKRGKYGSYKEGEVRPTVAKGRRSVSGGAG